MTDRQTDGLAIAYSALSMLSRANKMDNDNAASMDCSVLKPATQLLACLVFTPFALLSFRCDQESHTSKMFNTLTTMKIDQNVSGPSQNKRE